MKGNGERERGNVEMYGWKCRVICGGSFDKEKCWKKVKGGRERERRRKGESKNERRRLKE